MTNQGRPPGSGDETPEELAERLRRSYLDLGRAALRDEAPERLDPETRQRMQRILGVDPGDVRLHRGRAASEAAEGMDAKAFTVGSGDVFFQADHYAPGTVEGDALLAHELTHVLEDAPGLSAEAPTPGADRGASEERAEAAEEVARQVVAASGPKGLTASQKRALVDKVVKVLQEQTRRGRERKGS